MENNQFLNWIKENFLRFASAHPVFFKWWIRIFTFFLTLNGIPELLAYSPVSLPESWTDITKQWIAFISIGGLWMSWIATPSKVVAVSNEGELLKETDPKMLPFTAIAEIKAEAKKEDGILNPETPKEQIITELTMKK